MGLVLHANGKVDMVATSMDVRSGNWKLTGTTLDATFYLGESYLLLAFKAEVAGDSMQATCTWNEGTDGGPEAKTCELRSVGK